MITAEDVIKALESEEEFNIQLIPEKVWKTLIGEDEPKPEEDHNCVICGELAGSMRGEKEGWYCNYSSITPERKNCWRTVYEEDIAGIQRIRVNVVCPFCEIIHTFLKDRTVIGTCGCGAKFYEGYHEMIHFKRRK